jgi:hypothetical protein
MAAAERTELLYPELVGLALLVFGGRIVAAFATLA